MNKKGLGILKLYRRRPYRSLALTASMVLLMGTLVYHFVEGWRILDSLYFSVITLTTVGYGDFSPQSDFGKVFTIFYVLIGIGIILGFINATYEYRKEKVRKRIKGAEDLISD
jgi:hypothetical protein